MLCRKSEKSYSWHIYLHLLKTITLIYIFDIVMDDIYTFAVGKEKISDIEVFDGISARVDERLQEWGQR